MRNIKLTIEYDGTNYCGWQIQANAISIQALIEKALRKILHKNIKVTSASRTDSGVHAKGQVANFNTNSKLSLKEIKKALNGNLPKDIRVVAISNVKKDFNAQFSAKSKLYRYAIYNREDNSPFFDRFSIHIPLRLNIKKMKKASSFLLGRHDFSSFKGAKGTTKTSIRNIKRVCLNKSKDFIFIDIESDGFLYNMARNIAGTLIEIGREKIAPLDMLKILSFRDRTKAGPTAPAKGLTLIKVKY